MAQVFIAGSIQITNVNQQVKARIIEMLKGGFDVVVGDAKGVDTSVQTHLFNVQAQNVVVYCAGDEPRNNVGAWQVRNVKSEYPKGTREFYTSKDLQMAQDADTGLMIWDSNSTGTLSNVIELLQAGKSSSVFVDVKQAFQEVGDVSDLEKLVDEMDPYAMNVANDKIGLFNRIDALRHG